MPGINLKGGGAKVAHGAGRAGHGIGQAASAAGKIGQGAGQGIGKTLGKAGNFAGRLGGRGAERAAHGAGRAAHWGGHGAKRAGQPVARGAENLAKKIGEKVVDTSIETAGAALAGTVGREVGKIIAKHKKETLILILLILTASLLPFLFFLYLLLGKAGDIEQQQKQQDQTSPLTVTVDCNPPGTKDSPLNVGDTSICTITVTDTQSADDITVVATIYPFAQYVNGSATPANITYDAKNATVTWDAKKLKMQLSAPISLTFFLTVKKTVNKNGVPVVATANATGGGATGGNIAANNNNCHGVYSSWMAVVQPVLSRIGRSGANYGDPSCQLVKQDPNGTWIIDKDKELAYLETILPKQKAQGVFTCMIPNESSYNADATNRNSTSAGSGGTPGAFGLLQMNAQKFSNQGQPDDVGDVVWSLQLTNAVNWVKNTHGGLWHGTYKGIHNYWPDSYNPCLAKYGM